MAAEPLEPALTPTPFLPIDIVLTEILPKLPAKSLIRFKSVCKSFKTVISSPEFARLHLRQSLSSDNRLIFIPTVDRTLYSFDLDSPSFTESAASSIFFLHHYHVPVVGACNGLLLLFLPYHFVLLNPYTRTYINIRGRIGVSDVGFGFDVFAHDYKIVTISEYDENAVKRRDTAIYSVNSKSWKVVDHALPLDAIDYRRPGGVLINNHLLHWMFWNSRGKRRVGCFDVCSEEWKDDVLLPGYYYDPSHENYLLDIGVLDGYLCSSFENRVDFVFDIWVMKEYGDQESWIKLLSINISNDLEGGVVPIACRGIGSSEVLLTQRHSSNLFWYHRETNVITKVEVPNFDGFRPYVCKGSLVSLPDAKLFGARYELEPGMI